MAIYANQQKERELPAAGPHVARCFGIIDIGTHLGRYGKTRDVVILWEFCGETTMIDDTQVPVIVWRRFNNSLNEDSHLSNLLVPWRGKTFTDEELGLPGHDPNKRYDLELLIGQPCQVQIIHEPKTAGGTKYVVASVSQLMKGTPRPKGTIEQIKFSLGDDSPIPELLGKEKWGEWIIKEIHASDEWIKIQNDHANDNSHIGQSPEPTGAFPDGYKDEDFGGNEHIPF